MFCRHLYLPRRPPDDVGEYLWQEEAEAQLKETTTQKAALKASMDAAASEAAVVAKGLEDALARAKAEIEQLQVLRALRSPSRDDPAGHWFCQAFTHLRVPWKIESGRACSCVYRTLT